VSGVMEKKMFWVAVEDGKAEEVKEILRGNPTFNVNCENEKVYGNITALMIACENGHDSIVSILLAHPDIDVNLKSRGGYTAISHACNSGFTSCVRLLLKDSRVKVNEPGDEGNTPLWFASFVGHLDVIRWWIASGREMDLGEPKVHNADAIWAARRRGKTDVVTLLKKFKENPEETRRAMRVEVGWYDKAAAEVFALVVFVSDGLLQVKVTTTTTTVPAARFFSIVTMLPLELQMVLCCQVVGLPKDIIPGKDSEVAFRDLASGM